MCLQIIFRFATNTHRTLQVKQKHHIRGLIEAKFHFGQCLCVATHTYLTWNQTFTLEPNIYKDIKTNQNMHITHIQICLQLQTHTHTRTYSCTYTRLDTHKQKWEHTYLDLHVHVDAFLRPGKRRKTTTQKNGKARGRESVMHIACR